MSFRVTAGASGAPITGDIPIDDLRRDVADLKRLLSETPFAAGRWIKGINLAIGTNYVPHGLGRKHTGFVIISPRLNVVTCYELPIIATDERSRTFIQLVQPSVAATIDLWVF